MISVIIPVHGAQDLKHISMASHLCERYQDIEFLFIGNIVEELIPSNLKQSHPIQFHQLDTHSRAVRLNAGVKLSRGEMILFHHPRSCLEEKAWPLLIKQQNLLRWGGFTHRFDIDHPLLNFTSYYSNRVRGHIRGILYLDHCIFFHRKLWRYPIPEVDIFEDTYLSKMLNTYSSPILLPLYSTTSAIRFQENGIWYQSILNQILKLGFILGVSDQLMNILYEKGLHLNASYCDKK